MENMKVIIPETILWRKDGDQAVLFDEERGEPYLLNDTAARVWELCQHPVCVGEIINALAAEFEGETQTIKKETLDLLSRLEEKKLLRLVVP